MGIAPAVFADRFMISLSKAQESFVDAGLENKYHGGDHVRR